MWVGKFERLHLLWNFSGLSYLKVRVILQKETFTGDLPHVQWCVIPSKEMKMWSLSSRSSQAVGRSTIINLKWCQRGVMRCRLWAGARETLSVVSDGTRWLATASGGYVLAQGRRVKLWSPRCLRLKWESTEGEREFCSWCWCFWSLWKGATFPRDCRKKLSHLVQKLSQSEWVMCHSQWSVVLALAGRSRNQLVQAPVALQCQT